VLNTPDTFATEVNKLIFDNVWKYKNSKIKKSTLIKSKENEGLNMVHFTLFDKALKISCLKRLCSEGNQRWKFIPLHFLSGVGGTLVFRCNYDSKYWNLSANLPTFYKDIISHWQELNKVVPTTKKDVLEQSIWNNRFVTINKASVYFQNWHHAGIHKLSSLFDENNNRFLSFNEFSRKFKVQCNILQYHGLLSAISSERKKNLKQEQRATTVILPEIDKLTCQTIYKSLIYCQNLPPPATEKRLIECGFDIHERQKIYSLPFVVTKEIKLSIF